ncbi:hypothetical protein HYN59_17050 [Flavobacterium album]|uniref:DinB-like domain-containing protein n=1 Tax=Flavobacterium album TaxID=2175091 RepID=A0A2S1R201_9FLAO|nr:DinB family protein [Flavobacterium album]AWH86708.1 hypothetical protein HYN59_17050 [Flavobacterium album]
MKTSSKSLLQELEKITQDNSNTAAHFLTLSEEQLNFKASPGSWSILECLEHLNRYSAFYLPELRRHLTTSRTETNPIFKSGLWGNYLVKMVIPKEGGKKMKTFTAMNPSGSKLDKAVISQFIETQTQLLGIIESAGSADLNVAGIPVTFTKLIKLRLGDALRFMAYHNQRHVQQAQRIHS